MTTKTIYLDCDGTWIDLYGVENWLSYLINRDPYPYIAAQPMVNLSLLARTIHQLQANGFKVGIISWLSKNGDKEYNQKVTEAKLNWFKKRIPSVSFDEIHIIPYGTPKSSCANGSNCILFDDEKANRDEWKGISFSEENLIQNLRKLMGK